MLYECSGLTVLLELCPVDRAVGTLRPYQYLADSSHSGFTTFCGFNGRQGQSDWWNGLAGQGSCSPRLRSWVHDPGNYMRWENRFHKVVLWLLHRSHSMEAPHKHTVTIIGGWRDGLGVKRANRSRRGPGFHSQHPPRAAHNYLREHPHTRMHSHVLKSKIS